MQNKSRANRTDSDVVHAVSGGYLDNRPARALAHVLLGTPETYFLAIEDDPTRLPLDDIRLNGSAIQWLRADGYPEKIDLDGCSAKEQLLEQFLSDAGVLIAVFPTINEAELQSDQGPAKFMIVARHGYTEVVEDAAVLGAGRENHGGG